MIGWEEVFKLDQSDNKIFMNRKDTYPNRYTEQTQKLPNDLR